MRYYFFQTSEQLRDGKMKPTLRALPGQTFPDGTPVDETYNVQAPKEPGSSANGCRLEYPLGTIFCSTFLKEIRTANAAFYSVYDDENGFAPGQQDPDFHPVSEKKSFKYVKTAHRSDRMNAALVIFNTFGDQTDGTDGNASAARTKAAPKAPAVRFSPADKNGKAKGPIPEWAPAYDDQVSTESELVVNWIMKVLREMGVNVIMLAKRPKVDGESIQKFQALYRCGESADTITVRSRFEKKLAEEKMDASNLQILMKGPLEWYLDLLVQEHDRGLDCSALPRSADAAKELDDLSYIVCQGINRLTGAMNQHDAPGVKDDFKKAVEKGWTLDDILVPEVLAAKPDAASLASALANGTIPLPEREGSASGNSYIDKLMSLKQNSRPEDKDGFHVDELTWKLLVLNLNRRKNTLLVGPTGSGKTVLIQKLCEQTGTPCTIIPMGTITDPTEQLVGKMDIANNPNSPKAETEFDWADFALAIQRPGVILLDEINRVPRNGYNILFSVLDGTRTLVASGAKSSDKRTIAVHPDCVFFATANIGSEYTGTEELDAAFDNRFRRIEVDYLDVKTETSILVARTGINKKDAENIALVAKNIRNKFAEGNGELAHAVSTRETLECAEYVKDGFSVEDALEIAFLPHFERGRSESDTRSERGIVKGMIATRFNS